MYIERLIPNIPEVKKAGFWEKALGVGNCGHLEGGEVINGNERELRRGLHRGLGGIRNPVREETLIWKI